MTIRKRLTVSGILMVLVPVLLAAAIGSGCIYIIWTWTVEGGGAGFADSQEFYDVCESISGEVEAALREAGGDLRGSRRLQAICREIEEEAMRLVIRSGGEALLDSGEAMPSDTALLEAVRLLGDHGFVSDADRALYARTVETGDTGYRILLYGTRTEQTWHALGRFVAAAALLFAVLILLIILLANRFLTAFVFRSVMQPIAQLTEGVAHIRDGDLDYRIVYPQKGGSGDLQ